MSWFSSLFSTTKVVDDVLDKDDGLDKSFIGDGWLVLRPWLFL